MYDFVIIGGGIVGLATALRIKERNPQTRLVVLEKESSWASHQTARNSGVIHSGIYYNPGSLKAQLAKRGNHSMVAFCQKHGIEHEICGKLIVATNFGDLPQLNKLYERGVQNGLGVTRITADEAKEIEPKLNCVAAIRVPTAGIVSYRRVCEVLVSETAATDTDLRLNAKLTGISHRPRSIVAETTQGFFEARFLINCAGLHSDRVARLEGSPTEAKIVPFRGEYYELKPERRNLIKNLIYPVPNPAFPFLGVHFTRMIDGSVHAGPNAVLSLKREGYTRLSFDLRDALETLGFGGFWKLARKYPKEGLQEIVRSFSKAVFVRSLQTLIPEIQPEDLLPTPSGVRAQALLPTGALVDDFLFRGSQTALHVCNAPSPAATASLEIASHIVDQLPVELVVEDQTQNTYTSL